MPRKDRKKSKHEHLYKRCQHLSWDKCDCPWWGRVKRQRVSLAKWAGEAIPNKEKAKAVLIRMDAAVLAGTFNKRGERANEQEQAAIEKGILLSVFLDDIYVPEHKTTQRTGTCSPAVLGYVEVFKAELGQEYLRDLSANPDRCRRWLEDRAKARKWEAGSFNRYLAYGKAIFNKARRKKLVADNPFGDMIKRDENNRRENRLSPEQERRLLDACDRLDDPAKSKLIKVDPQQVAEIRRRVGAGELQKDLAVEFGISRALVCQIVNGKVRKPPTTTMGSEMRRRVIAAIDLGLRAGEMLLLQVKHIDYKNWIIHLPKTITKAKKDQQLYVRTPRLKAILDERKTLGLDAYVFGRESGKYVASFDGAWNRLFKLVGLPTGRKSGYVWHDLRHEYGSYLIDQGAKIHEVMELMRHADIRTTQKYLKAKDERLEELAGRMSQRSA
jgi:integrase